jgi:two-component system sensor histidine kinase YesM
MDTKQLTIHAPYAFFENPWTQIGLLFVFFGGLSFFIIYRSVQNRKILAKDLKLSKMSQEKDQLQLQSIISSFNPHFINNSLHWAQSRYRKDEELVNVIGSLSENIGYIFTNTRKGIAVHSVTDEMKLVRNYVSIQQIRFDSSFEFNEPSPEKMGKYRDFQIPIMQLQIHVENAIEHGLRNRIESSFVQLSIEEDDSYVEFMVTDDGCGREKAKLLESHGTQTGTKMLKALHGLFNQLDENKLPIITQYQDNIYTDPAGNRYGTSVIIKIPKHFTYELEKI